LGKQVPVSGKSFHGTSQNYQFRENGYPFSGFAPSFHRKPYPISTQPTTKPGFLPPGAHHVISAKHTALGASSPLGNLKWTEIGPALTAAQTHDDAAADLAKQAEKEYRDRDVMMPKVTQALRDARDTLLVANRENPKALGDFG
jgi:hypothetical protein